MHICYFGGTGFIAAHVVKLLSESGHQVTVVSREASRSVAFKALPGVSLRDGDYSDAAFLRECLPGHDACVTNVLSWGKSPLAMLMNDTRPTVQLLETAAECGIGQFLYTSSTAAIGDFRHDMTEEFISLPIDSYCATKRATELFILGFAHGSSMRCNIIRPGYTFGNPAFDGAREHAPDGWSIFCKIARAAVAGEPIEIMERMGTQYLGASDIALVYRAVLEGPMNRQIYHALAKPWYSEEQIARKAIEIAKSPSTIVLKPNPDTGRHKEFTLDKIEREFGFRFDGWPHITAHLEYLIDKYRAA